MSPVPPPDAAPALGPGKRAAFWTITLLGPPLLLLGGLEMGLRLHRHLLAPTTREDLGRRLQESATTEVQVVPAGSLRGLVRASSAPRIVYELKPGRNWLFLGQRTATNSLGFRGREYAAEKPQGTLRVVGVGDSVMFGWGVGQDESYMSLLESSLPQALSGAAVEVLNLAVPGYNSLQEAETFERKALPLRPDVLLVNYCLNDWAAPFFLPDPDRGGALQEKSALFAALSERLGRDAEREYSDMQGMDKVASSLDRIGTLAAAKGIPVVFFAYPQAVKPEGREKIVALARSRGFVYVDLWAALDAYCREKGLSGLGDLVLNREDGHPNPEAHRLFARTLLPVVADLLRARRR